MIDIAAFKKSRFFKYGLPFLVVVVGGSFGLKEFAQLRYTFSNKTSISVRESIKKKGIEMKDPDEITLEGEYEKMKKLNIDDWEQVRGPRPWEENVN